MAALSIRVSPSLFTTFRSAPPLSNKAMDFTFPLVTAYIKAETPLRSCRFTSAPAFSNSNKVGKLFFARAAAIKGVLSV